MRVFLSQTYYFFKTFKPSKNVKKNTMSLEKIRRRLKVSRINISLQYFGNLLKTSKALDKINKIRKISLYRCKNTNKRHSKTSSNRTLTSEKSLAKLFKKSTN